MDQPVGGHQPGPADLLTDSLGAVKHDRGLLHPEQDAAGEGTVPPRPGLASRVQQAAERVEVVAVDADAIGRQDVDELRVGMIGDVEQVESIGEPPGMAGEVDEPVKQPVGIERGVSPADGRQPGGEPAERRAEASDFDGERPLPRQVGKEHVPAQVHARPALVGEVGQDGVRGVWVSTPPHPHSPTMARILTRFRSLSIPHPPPTRACP